MFKSGYELLSQSLQRREFLRCAGGLAAAGFVLPTALGISVSACGDDRPSRDVIASPGTPGRATSCIVVYLLGGPPHLDMFDLKPDAPAEIRGPFQPIATAVPGTQICELLPELARRADRYALVRSVSHRNSNHTPMIYYTLTGRDTEFPDRDNDVRAPQRTDFPHFGSIVSRFLPGPGVLPGYVAIQDVAVRSSIAGEFKRARMPLRGGNAGFLGARFDPLSINGVVGTADAVPTFSLPDGISTDRFEERSAVLSRLENAVSSSQGDDFALVRRRAILLTGAANNGHAPLFSLDSESRAARERYGQNRFGQSLLLARRLTEAGVPLVAIHFNEMSMCDGWDTHSRNFSALQDELLPMLDKGLSALLDDLQQRGRFDETLVACFGEFGRTPRINANAGRDHWGDCSTTWLAGGGIRGGMVHGASDRHGAFPQSDAVDPSDIQATLFHCLGLDPATTIGDHLDRPHAISLGKVIRPLLATT